MTIHTAAAPQYIAAIFAGADRRGSDAKSLGGSFKWLDSAEPSRGEGLAYCLQGVEGMTKGS